MNKEVARINKNREEIIKNVSYNLLIAQDLWQGHYQMLLITFQGIHRIKCKFQHSNKKCGIKRIKLELNVECRM